MPVIRAWTRVRGRLALLRVGILSLLALLVVALVSRLAVTAGAGAAKEPPVSGGTPRAVVNVADFADPQSPTAGLQKAIDALPASGGLVTLPPGEYLLRQSVHLRSNVTLQGAGGSTIIRRGGQAESKLTDVARQGSSSVRVENAALFREGDEVGILDKESLGWNVGNALVKGVRDKEVLLDRRLPRSYDPAKGGRVVHCFPALLATGASRLLVKDLVLDGRIKDKGGPTGYELSFKMAAIHFIDATDSRIEGCQILGWASDGICLSRGGTNAVVRCLVQDCGGHGFHPGGGVRDSVFSDNVAHGNGRDGLYFCMNVRHVIVSNNVFAGNKGNGIGGLGDSGDKYNVVTGNVCRANGANGICVVDGDNNSVTNNICINNSQSIPGRYSGISLNKTAETIVTGNRCLDDQETKTQKHGIVEFSSCRANLFGNNLCRGNAQASLALAGKDSQQSGNLE